MKVMKRLIFFVLSVAYSINLPSQNHNVNPGFEIWQKINKPTGWTTALGCLKDSAIIHTGNYSCRQAATADSRDLGQLIPVSEGRLYRISFWYRNELPGNGCRIWSGWKDDEGNAIDDDPSLTHLHSGFLKSESWKQFSADVTAPASAAYFNLIIRTLPNSVTYWDDVVFEESVATHSNELISHDIRIYPNPVSDYLTISNISNMQLIDILTLAGTKIWTSGINGEESLVIPVAGLKNDIYIINMYGSSKRFSGRFIKTGF